MIVEIQTKRDGQISLMVQESSNTIDSDRLSRIVRQRLESLAFSGLTNLPKPKGHYQIDLEAVQLACAQSSEPISDSPPRVIPSETGDSAIAKTVITAARDNAPPNGPNKPETSVVGTDYPKSAAENERIHQLSVLGHEVVGCTKCPELARCRTQTVFGVGSPSARLVFLGEGPGADEDRQGEPFVGAAGQLLNRIIEACKMNREDVYIMNTVKCRPPQNRNPSEIELENCWDFAKKQLEIIQPEYICCLGSVAARKLLQTKQSIGKMRQKFFDYRGSRVVVTYHPAYLLRTPSAKKHVWADMKMLMEGLGIDI